MMRQRLLLLILTAGWLPWAAAGINESDARARVEAAPCKNATVRQVLDQTINQHTQRDLGWRVFVNPDDLEVERAVMINKGMELRYRWRVNTQGQVQAGNDRAERLCS